MNIIKKFLCAFLSLSIISLSGMTNNSHTHVSAATIHQYFNISDISAIAYATVGYSNYFSASTNCDGVDYVGVTLSGYCKNTNNTVSNSDLSYSGRASTYIYSVSGDTFKSGASGHYGRKGSEYGSLNLTL